MIGAASLTISEPVSGGVLTIRYAMSSRERTADRPADRQARGGPAHQAAASPPAILRLDSEQLWESGEPELRLLAAAIADAIAGRPRGGPTVESVWLRVTAEAEGRVGLNGRELPAEVDDDLRRALLGPSALDLVLGYVNAHGEDVVGLAGLTPPEREAVEFWLSPPGQDELEARQEGESTDPSRRTAREVRDLMGRRRRRHAALLAIKTVQNLLSSARGKLRRCADLAADDPLEVE